MIATGVVIVAAGGWLLGAAGWWSSVSGTPRVSVDRTDIDLGDLRFDTAARAVFTVSNVGDGTLQLSVPPVEALQGC